MAESMGEKGLLKVMLALACLLVLVSIVAYSDSAAGEDRSGIQGVQPPFYGDWFITSDTNVTGENLSFAKNIYVARLVNLIIRDSTINIEYDPFNPHQYVFNIETAAVLTVINSTLVLDTFVAHGQAALTFQGGSHVSTTGRFLAECSAIFVYDTTFSNICPKDAIEENERGEDAVFVLDGRVNSELINVTVHNQASAAGNPKPSFDGASGGSSLIISNCSIWIRCDIRALAGVSSDGGLGLAGTSGGTGGLGGDAEMLLVANVFDRTNITVFASNGGTGARGADNTVGDAGDGGNGANGGNARLSIFSPSTLEFLLSTIRVESGDGGSGGNGGTATNGVAGSAGDGAVGGIATIEINSVDDLTIEETALSCIGGDGGYGGDYGRREGTSGELGIPKPGGDGGAAMITITGDVNLYSSKTKVMAKGGAGYDGGSGYDQGETGGNGADGLLKIRVGASIEADDLDLSATGGKGGNGGAAFSNIWGNGGDGGDAKLEFSGLLDMYVNRFFIYTYIGTGGKGNKDIWNGADGIGTFDLETQALEMWDGRFNQPLDDLAGDARGYLYNCTFDFSGLPALPQENAEVWTYYPVDIWVVDSFDPQTRKGHKDYEVRIIDAKTNEVIAIRKTDEGGRSSVYLSAFDYTSQEVIYVGGYIVSAISPDGKNIKEVRLDVQEAILWPEPFIVVVPINTHPPVALAESPEDERSYTFVAPSATIIEAFGTVTDEDESPITSMFVRLFPENDDSNNWPRMKLTLSPVPYDRVTESEYKWGKYFEPTVNQNKWRYFYRFTILGGDVLYKSGAYIFELGAYDGVQWGFKRVPIDIKITPPTPPPYPRPWATVAASVEALSLAEFNGSVMNVEELKEYRVEIKFYAWDFTGDGELDWYSTKDGATFYIYQDVDVPTAQSVIFSVVDTLGRQVNVTKQFMITPKPVEEKSFIEYFYQYFPYIIGIVLVVLIVFGILSVRARRVREAQEEEERKRVEEALANIHECPRCGTLLDSKFATCNKCKTEDMLLEVQELVTALKEQGIVALEQEDLLEKALISFEGLDYDTAMMFIAQAKDQAIANKQRYEDTVKELAGIESLIKGLTDKGIAIPDVEMRVYHSKLALTRSDFKGAKEIADALMVDVKRLDAENRKDDIFDAIQKAEREVRTAKALGEKDTVPASRAVEAAKAEFGTQDYVKAETALQHVYKLLKDPTWSPEKDRLAEEERAKVAAALKASEAETLRIMEEERKRQEALKAVSVASSAEVKVATFKEEAKPVEERVVVASKGKVVEHVAVHERVVEAEEPVVPQMPALHLEARPEEAAPAPAPEVAAPPPEPEPVREPEEPKPVAAPKPVPTAHPVAAAHPVATAHPVAASRPVAAPRPVARPVPRPAPAPSPRPAEGGEKEEAKAAPAPAPVPASAADKVPCKKCGRQIKPSWKKCPFCGETQ